MDGINLVFDNGSGFFKAGRAGQNEPEIDIASIVGIYRFTCFNEFGYSGMDSPIQVGHDALMHKSKLRISYPFDLSNYDPHSSWQAEEIFKYAFKKLDVDQIECFLLLTEPVCNTHKKREIIAQVSFESFSVPGIYIASQGVLPLYAAGLTNGLVVNCGHSETSSTPIYEGYALQNSTQSIKLGGRDLNEYLLKTLNKIKGDEFLKQENVNVIKEKLCYVALDYKQKLSEESTLLETEYKLPDDTIIKLNNELFKCPEILFQPSILDSQLPGVHEIIINSIKSTDIDARKNIYSNIVIAGGSTLFQGFTERLEKELNLMLNNDCNNIRLISPTNRKNSAWVGGSMLASLSTFQDMCVSSYEYGEYGPNIIHRKCL